MSSLAWTLKVWFSMVLLGNHSHQGITLPLGEVSVPACTTLFAAVAPAALSPSRPSHTETLAFPGAPASYTAGTIHLPVIRFKTSPAPTNIVEPDQFFEVRFATPPFNAGVG